jgi:hypothetical protein
MELFHRKIFIVFIIITAFYSGGCAFGWHGVPEFKQKLDLAGEKKSDVVDDFGVPDASFERNSSEEYWLYKLNDYYYIILFGERKLKGLIVEFKGDTVHNVFIVDHGVIDKILMKGWEYGIREVTF